MSASLRTRLLLSYGLLIAVLMCLFSAGLLVSLLRNPLVYESAAQKLRTAQRIVSTHTELLASISADPDVDRMEQAARLLTTRVVFVREDGTLVADSQMDSVALRVQPVRLKFLAQRNEITFLRDDSNHLWLVLVQSIDAQSYLLLAVSRPQLLILELFTNEFLRPVVLTGLVGLALAVLIALGLAQWISSPLKRIGLAADAVAAGLYKPITPTGPDEVRLLANSFNRMTQRVQDAIQSQRDLVANVSHELKTPLTSIQGFTQAILDGVSLNPEEIHQAAEAIFDESNRMSRLVQDLVTLARLETEMADLHRTPVDISALVRGVTEKFRPQAVKDGVQLNLDVPDLNWLLGDEDRLVQVITNLVDNAIKYTPAGGVVGISARPRGNTIEIRVADTGVGIDPVDRERIFQRFYRADRSQPGTGLGLAISRQIVQSHGGTIHVEGNTPRGSVFIVELPCSTHLKQP
jgi:Signal transduction histidine kinase